MMEEADMGDMGDMVEEAGEAGEAGEADMTMNNTDHGTYLLIVLYK
jgi:hypothetical protein